MDLSKEEIHWSKRSSDWQMDTPILNVLETESSTVWTDIQHILSNENKAEESIDKIPPK